MSNHEALSPERWARFSLDQQILMIANEVNRIRHAVARMFLKGRRGTAVSG